MTWIAGVGVEEHKHTLELSDVDYGHSGQWSWSVWFRHDDENFDYYEREQFLGHGDPLITTGGPNQFHVQIEKDGRYRNILYGSSIDTIALSETLTNTSWHQYVITTISPKGYAVYIDGELQACNYISGGSSGFRRGGIWDENGGAFDPLGAIRVCGRAKPETFGNDDDTAQETVVISAIYTPLIECVIVFTYYL